MWLFVFGFAAALGGILFGAVAGIVGNKVGLPGRVPLVLMGLVGIVLGFREGTRQRLRLWQFNRETPRSWGHGSPLSWAVRTGLVIGSGAFTRIGFTVWYVAVGGAVVLGDPRLGAAAIGLYGGVRGLSALPIGVRIHQVGISQLGESLLRLRPVAVKISAGATLLASSTALVVGLS